ncbi:MAG: ABC transporter substrate-binding protein [Prolixibacteraceae bacterium]|nr:ABC transporter substrate-binding protein [Prolixibacteraceae bacterium]
MIKKFKINIQPKSIMLLLAFILLSNACSRNEQEQKNAEMIDAITYTDTINFVGHWLNEGIREDFVKNIARVYEFENQNIKVNLKFPEDIYYDKNDRLSNQKYIARVIEEDLANWDILRINGEYQELTKILNDPDWAKKHLVDFSQIEEFREGTIPELLTDEAKAAWNGIIPGPYVEGQYWAVWANKEVADKIGIEVKQFGMTFDDFANYLKATYRYNQNNPDDYIIPIYESYVWETTMSIAINLYSSLLNDREEFLSGTITEKRLQAWGKTLEAMESIAKYDPINPKWEETEWGNTHNMMLDGKCLFYVNGSWMYNIWEVIDSEKVLNCLPCEYPAFKTHITYPASYPVTWGVPKNAPHKDKAVKFLLAMNKPNIAEMWSRYTKCPTGIKGNLSNAALGGDQFEEFVRQIQDHFGTNTYRYYETSSWVLNDQHTNTPIYFREVVEGKMTADEAMTAIRSSIGQ